MVFLEVKERKRNNSSKTQVSLINSIDDDDDVCMWLYLGQSACRILQGKLKIDIKSIPVLLPQLHHLILLLAASTSTPLR